MKSDKACKIVSGEMKYSLRQFKEDLHRDIDCEEDDEVTREAFFDLYMNVIYLSCIDFSFRDIVKVLTTEAYPDLPRDLARNIVRDIRAGCKEEIKVMRAIWMRKYCDFIALGASEEKALDLLNRWIREEF
jgi:dGTP triphosphohydrolase